MRNLFALIFCFLSLCSFANIKKSPIENLFPQPKKTVELPFVVKKSVLFYPAISNVNFTMKDGEYKIDVTPLGVFISAKDDAGFFYANQTLNQIKSNIQTLDSELYYGFTIEDYPDFERRGLMLDVSRDKMPTMETLFKIIDIMASLKMNEFQLYIEHTFAYKDHEIVWKNYSPLTAKKMQELDKYCSDRFIDFVPNQNSFGHMNKWLVHKEYQDMAEAINYVNTKWGKSNLNVLCPVEPKTIDFIKSIYAEFLPNFKSQFFNIGCDETLELGLGRSKEACEKYGYEIVYLDYLLKLNSLAREHKKQAMFWDDIIHKYPSILNKIPSDMILMIWGYEDIHPFDEIASRYKGGHFQFYVCPGTSSWTSLTGRETVMKVNVSNAAKAGLENGAKGLLVTNWGDFGNWQTLPTYMPGIFYSAGVSWGLQENKDISLTDILSNYLFKDESKKTAEALIKMSNYYLLEDSVKDNKTGVVEILRYPHKDLKKSYYTKNLTIEQLQSIIEQMNLSLNLLLENDMKCKDRLTIEKELKFTASLIKFGCKLGIEKLASDNILSLETKQNLLAEFVAIKQEFLDLWLIRNEIGGRENSIKKLSKIETYLK